MEPIVDSMDCPVCGVGVKRTGMRGRPRKLCQGCRKPKAKARAREKAKVYAAEFCIGCGEQLPAKRDIRKRYCNDRCGNTAWVKAHRAELKARALTGEPR